MAANYLAYDPQQLMLLPEALQDWLSKAEQRSRPQISLRSTRRWCARPDGRFSGQRWAATDSQLTCALHLSYRRNFLSEGCVIDCDKWTATQSQCRCQMCVSNYR